MRNEIEPLEKNPSKIKSLFKKIRSKFEPQNKTTLPEPTPEQNIQVENALRQSLNLYLATLSRVLTEYFWVL